MKIEEKHEIKTFAEFAVYDDTDEQDKKNAIQYLKDWKKYLLKKLKSELYDYEPYFSQIVDGENAEVMYEVWIYRPAGTYGFSDESATVCLKFRMRKRLPYQID